MVEMPLEMPSGAFGSSGFLAPLISDAHPFGLLGDARGGDTACSRGG